MKKFITVAALVAAGTALASAANWETVLENAEVSTGTSTLGELGMSGSYAYDEYSWVVSFTLANFSTGNGGVNVFDTIPNQTTGNEGFAVLINTGNGRINIADANANHIGTPNMDGTTDPASAFSWSENSDPLTFYFYWNAEKEAFTLYAYQSDALIHTTTLAVSDCNVPISFATLNSSTATFTSSDGSVPVTGIAVYVSDVPEPSMFGVFAGLGALGFVAARRRRNRKA